MSKRKIRRRTKDLLFYLEHVEAETARCLEIQNRNSKLLQERFDKLEKFQQLPPRVEELVKDLSDRIDRLDTAEKQLQDLARQVTDHEARLNNSLPGQMDRVAAVERGVAETDAKVQEQIDRLADLARQVEQLQIFAATPAPKAEPEAEHVQEDPFARARNLQAKLADGRKSSSKA
jgi:chromosome segregation ATPase